MPGPPRKTTLKQRQTARRRAEAWCGLKRDLYKLLAVELHVSFRTIERIVQG